MIKKNFVLAIPKVFFTDASQVSKTPCGNTVSLVKVSTCSYTGPKREDTSYTSRKKSWHFEKIKIRANS